MLPRFLHTKRAKAVAAHHVRRRSLRALAKELQIPDDAADRLIEEVLLASVLQRSGISAEQRLAAVWKMAKRLEARGE